MPVFMRLLAFCKLPKFMGKKKGEETKKIAVIGGAGVRTVIFINGLLARYKALHIDEVALYDINQEKQQIITKLCRHVVNRNHKV